MDDLSQQLETRLAEIGNSTSMTIAICSSFHSAGLRLDDQGLTWDTATENDIANLITGVGANANNKRHRLRTALKLLFSDAANRWPAFYAVHGK